MKMLVTMMMLWGLLVPAAFGGLTYVSSNATAEIWDGPSDVDPFLALADVTGLRGSGDEEHFVDAHAEGSADLLSPTSASVFAGGSISGYSLVPPFSPSVTVTASGQLELAFVAAGDWTLEFAPTSLEGGSGTGFVQGNTLAFLDDGGGPGIIFEADMFGPLTPTTFSGSAGSYTLEILTQIETTLELEPDDLGIGTDVDSHIALDLTFRETTAPPVPVPSSLLMAALGLSVTGMRRFRSFQFRG